MGTFGATVASLLDTYTKCLSLLKGFRGDDEDHGTPSELQSSLGTSLRSDRARVRRAYSSQLSHNGAQFEKGDAASRSALKRVLRKLTTALGEVVRSLGGRQSMPIDYNSLLALSNGSSLNVVRTINELSSRVSSRAGSSSSRQSVVSRAESRRRTSFQVEQKQKQQELGEWIVTPLSSAVFPEPSYAGVLWRPEPHLYVDHVLCQYQARGDQAASEESRADNEDPVSATLSSSRGEKWAEEVVEGLWKWVNLYHFTAHSQPSAQPEFTHDRRHQHHRYHVYAPELGPDDCDHDRDTDAETDSSAIMPQDPAAALSALLRASSIQDHDEILKAANAAIKANKSDFVSQQTRIVALLKLDRFDDALRAIAEGGTKLNALCLLEQAYGLYKTGKLDEATTILQSIGLAKRSFGHMAAQVAYRAERFDDARAIYSRLLDADDDSGEENDLSINIRAAAAQSEWMGYSFMNPPPTQDSDGFEICYNAACACIARGSLDDAANLLQRAIRLCDASDDLNDKDKEAEMRPILAQQAYVYAKTGKLKEALDLYRSLAGADDDDPDLIAIARNNLLAMEPNAENPYVLQRKFAMLADEEKTSKLFKHQSNILRRNNFVVALHASKAPGVKSRTAALLGEIDHPTTSADINTLSILNATASAEGATGKQLIRNLQALATKRPNDVGVILTIVQIHLDNGHAGSALSILESFLQRLENDEAATTHDVRFSPGLVALVVALNRSQGRESSAKAELAKAAAHWQTRSTSPAASLLEEAGVELMKSSKLQDLQLAGTCFQRLFSEQQGSDIASAGLVACLAPSNLEAVQHHLGNLPPVEALIDGVDVKSLLDAGVATAAKPTQASKRPATQELSDKPKKRRRKLRLPKNYVEGTKPDPERWLPLRDRSSYRPKGKKGKKKAGETQGGVVKDEETLELVGGGGVKVEKAPPNPKKKKKSKK
ncbi:hypothetical protein AK830_g3022 [Neonectria ditissima]|uniref:Signal recognition particle subunit SRP72 n=1 Tax=Neonectria ditissima TaxID=78410 RepID=A0A0P7BQA7_9HYPO|nr:hypothetical protein AK830_g3022 [Neonectria ditissima]